MSNKLFYSVLAALVVISAAITNASVAIAGVSV